VELNDCLSIHPAEPRDDCARLVWFPVRRDGRCRVIAWTCHCERVQYELCAASGRAFIRRSVLDAPRATVETHRGSMAEVQRIWMALMCGEAE
jgi:hypothetical protein